MEVLVAIPASGRSPGEGNGNALQCSCLGYRMDRGSRQAAVHGVARSQTRLNDQRTGERGRKSEESGARVACMCWRKGARENKDTENY